MRILILGGTSFTGPHIVRALAAQGHALVIYHRGEHPMDLSTGAEEILAPLADLAAHQDSLRARRFDVVLHMMAMSRQDAESAVEIFAGHAGRMVVASSQDVYAPFGALLRKEGHPPSSLPITEESPLRASRY